MNLSGKVLAITGSDGALGQAAAATLSGYGATLALLEHGHTPTTAQPAGARHYGGIDLTQEDAARSVMERVIKDAGRLDGLINIAGGFHFEKLAGGTLDIWDSMYRINLRTAVVSCQAALPFLLQSGGGRIVNVGAMGAVKAAGGLHPLGGSGRSRGSHCVFGFGCRTRGHRRVDSGCGARMTAAANTSPGARFRAAVAAERPLQVVGAINAYAARMAAACGFKALYLSGGGVAANSLGIPDLGISTMDDVLIDVRRITDACPLPLLVDADTGWGGAFNIARTVKSFIKFGAAGLHIEDQVQAKRCGHRPGKEIVSKQEMVDRVKAAVDARSESEFVIMARTDALAVEGIDSAIERAIACVDAGADMIFPEAMTELAMYRRFKDAVKVPVLANITEFGHTPLYTREELGSVGVDIVLHCCSAYRAMNAAALATYQAIRRDGTQKNVLNLMQTRDELYRYLDYHAYEAKLDRLFAAGKEK